MKDQNIRLEELSTVEEMSRLKAELLQEYKDLEEPLEFADDDFEAENIQNKRDKLAEKIRELGSKIRQISA
jgi:hypothetical protein